MDWLSPQRTGLSHAVSGLAGTMRGVAHLTSVVWSTNGLVRMVPDDACKAQQLWAVDLMRPVVPVGMPMECKPASGESPLAGSESVLVVQSRSAAQLGLSYSRTDFAVRTAMYGVLNSKDAGERQRKAAREVSYRLTGTIPVIDHVQV